MLRAVQVAMSLLAFLAWNQAAWPQAQPQHDEGPGGHPHPGAGFHGRWTGGGAPHGQPGIQIGVQAPLAPNQPGMPGRAGYADPRAAGIGVQPFPGHLPPGNNPGFPFALGANVGLRAIPPVTMPPGVPNINLPGIQPLPTGALPPVPNINSPGGIPALALPGSGMPSPGWGPRFPRGHFPRPSGGTIIYSVPVGVPVYLPYVIYEGTLPTSSVSRQPQPGEPLVPRTPQAPESSDVILEYQPPQQPATPEPEVKPLTLLVFKDHTIVAVTDYWLEGETLYYKTNYGAENSVPLDRLDLALTQQLNRERNVRFVLEFRP